MNPEPAQFLPTIVVVAYNRTASLERLLRSLAVAVYPVQQPVRLLISIDKGNNREVVKLAQSFQWEYGTKQVLEQSEKLGLKAHIMRCAQFSLQYQSIILLEDDVFVSPYFYQYATQALAFYKSDEQVAGISLYHYQITESSFAPFEPLLDKNDVYFLQIAASWGQVWTAKQWYLFSKWYGQYGDTTFHRLPQYVQHWPDYSWKKRFIAYLIAVNRYFVFPRVALSTNFGDTGTSGSNGSIFQVQLQPAAKTYHFVTCAESVAKYDSWFELKPNSIKQLNGQLSAYDFTVDLYGQKQLTEINTPYLLSTQVTKNYELAFGASMYPLAVNIKHQTPGYDIKLCKKEDLLDSPYPNYKRYFRQKKLKNYLFEEVIAYPSVGILLPIFGEMVNIDVLVNNLVAQLYPELKVVLLNFTTKNLANHAAIVRHLPLIKVKNAAHKLDDTSADALILQALELLATDYLYVMSANKLLVDNTLIKLAGIVSKYKEVQCLYLPEKQQLAEYGLPSFRWSREHFYHSSPQELSQYFSWHNLFLSQALLIKIMSESVSNFYELLFCIIKYQKNTIYTLSEGLVSTNSGGLNKQQMPSFKPRLQAHQIDYLQEQKKKYRPSLVHLLLKPFFKADVPVLRFPYIEVTDLPKVLRWDEQTQSFYLSRY